MSCTPVWSIGDDHAPVLESLQIYCTTMNSGSFKGEFSQSNFGLGYPDPDIFVRSQWPLPCWTYIIWRVLWFLWYFIWIIVNGVHTSNQTDSAAEGAKWFIYLANWTFLLTTITFTVDLANVLYVMLSRNGSLIGTRTDLINSKENTTDSKSEKDDIVFRGQFVLQEGIKSHTTPWYLKLVWVLYNIANTSNILVTIVYWSLEHEGVADVHMVVVHAVNTVVLLLNLVVTAMPVRLLHMVYPVAYIVAYLLFSLVYQIADGTNLTGRDSVYKVVDWSKAYPTALTVVLGVVVIVPLVHVAVFAIYTFRIFFHAKMNSASYSPSGANSATIFENSIPAATSGANSPTIFECSIPTATSAAANSATTLNNSMPARLPEGKEENGSSIEMKSWPHPDE